VAGDAGLAAAVARLLAQNPELARIGLGVFSSLPLAALRDEGGCGREVYNAVARCALRALESPGADEHDAVEVIQAALYVLAVAPPPLSFSVEPHWPACVARALLRSLSHRDAGALRTPAPRGGAGGALPPDARAADVLLAAAASAAWDPDDPACRESVAALCVAEKDRFYGALSGSATHGAAAVAALSWVVRTGGAALFPSALDGVVLPVLAASLCASGVAVRVAAYRAVRGLVDVFAEALGAGAGFPGGFFFGKASVRGRSQALEALNFLLQRALPALVGEARGGGGDGRGGVGCGGGGGGDDGRGGVGCGGESESAAAEEPVARVRAEALYTYLYAMRYLCCADGRVARAAMLKPWVKAETAREPRLALLRSLADVSSAEGVAAHAPWARVHVGAMGCAAPVWEEPLHVSTPERGFDAALGAFAPGLFMLSELKDCGDIGEGARREVFGLLDCLGEKLVGDDAEQVDSVRQELQRVLGVQGGQPGRSAKRAK
jgi:hypothetical protein